jgi:hypothetical protein
MSPSKLKRLSKDGEDRSMDNPYLQKRAAKIERNNKRLRELGLIPYAPIEACSKKRLDKEKVKSEPTRKSVRQKILHSKRKESPVEIISDTARKNKAAANNATSSSFPSTTSSRHLSINVPYIIEKFLGRTLTISGKMSVICSTLEGIDNVSFNICSGVLEWKNAIYLWVNLDSKKDESVLNEFMEKGRQISWFGGSRMNEESSVIQRLLRLGKISDTTRARERSQIVLWCRQFDHSTNNFKPYICFGRLSYVSHQPDSHPLKFVWNLLDYDAMVNHKERAVRANFKNIING